jgi:hypothetical protein
VTAPKLALQDADRKVPIQMEKKWKKSRKDKIATEIFSTHKFCFQKNQPKFVTLSNYL